LAAYVVITAFINHLFEKKTFISCIMQFRRNYINGFYW